MILIFSTSSSASYLYDLIYHAENVPTFANIYQIAAKHGLVLDKFQRITHNYAYVGRAWLKQYLKMSKTRNFSDTFDNIVRLYIQLIPALTIDPQQISCQQATFEKVKFDASYLY